MTNEMTGPLVAAKGPTGMRRLLTNGPMGVDVPRVVRQGEAAVGAAPSPSAEVDAPQLVARHGASAWALVDSRTLLLPSSALVSHCKSGRREAQAYS